MAIATRNGIPSERVLPMRCVLTWKPVKNEQGQVTGRKPKARLIIKGLLDPDLLHLKRESPTLSTQNRSLLSVAAQRRCQAQIGDIKTAFLYGNDTERARNQGADPPPKVRAVLNMKPWETVRFLRVLERFMVCCMPPRFGTTNCLKFSSAGLGEVQTGTLCLQVD